MGGTFLPARESNRSKNPLPAHFSQVRVHENLPRARTRAPARRSAAPCSAVVGVEGAAEALGGAGVGCGSPGCSRGKAGCVRGSPFPEGPLPLAFREQEVKAGGANPRQGCRGSERPGALTAALRWLSATFQRNWRPCILEATTCRLVPLGRGPGSDLAPSSGHNHIGTKF